MVELTSGNRLRRLRGQIRTAHNTGGAVLHVNSSSGGRKRTWPDPLTLLRQAVLSKMHMRTYCNQSVYTTAWCQHSV